MDLDQFIKINLDIDLKYNKYEIKQLNLAELLAIGSYDYGRRRDYLVDLYGQDVCFDDERPEEYPSVEEQLEIYEAFNTRKLDLIKKCLKRRSVVPQWAYRLAIRSTTVYWPMAGCLQKAVKDITPYLMRPTRRQDLDNLLGLVINVYSDRYINSYNFKI